MITPQPCKAKLADKIVHNDKFTQYFFELTEPAQKEFLAGQYVSLKVSERGDRRSYSICSSPDTPHAFELLVDVTPNGLGTNYLANLQFGQEVEVLMPLGMFTIPENSNETSIALVATGSGVAPFMGMIKDQLQHRHDTRSITLYWGMREVNQLFWQDKFQELAEAFPNFHFHPVISQPIEGWPLCAGRVTDCLTTHEFDQGAGYYLCGNAPMLKDILAFLASKNIPQDHIHHEKFH